MQFKKIFAFTQAAIAFVICLSLAGEVSAAETPWETKLLTSMRLREEGNFEEALRVAEEYMRHAEKRYGPHSEILADALLQIGRIYSDQNLYTDAESFFSRVVTLEEHLYGINSPKLESSLMYLAGNFIGKKEFEQADKVYLRLLAIREAASGTNHTDLVTVLRAMATLYRLQGRAIEAEAVINRTLMLWQTPSATDFGVSFADIGSAHELQNLAALRVDKGRLTEAYSLYLQALKLLEKDLDKSRKKWGSPGNGTLARVIDCVDRLAILSRMLNKNDAGGKFEMRASALRAEMNGDALESPDTWGQSVFKIEASGINNKTESRLP